MAIDPYVIVPAADEETIRKLIKTIEELREALSNPEVLDLYKKLSGRYEETNLPFKSKGICKALKKCFVSHRFVDAAKLLECLSCEIGNSQIILKAGFQALENHPNMTPPRMLQFLCRIMGLNCLHRSEIALEAAIYFIKHELFEEAQSCIQEIEKAKRRCTWLTDPFIEELFSAYNGLLIYVEWAKLKYDSNCDSIEVKEQNMKIISHKVISIFYSLILKKGPWDIFVVKLVEMLEYYNRLKELEDALIQYVETNPLHIHAHLYLYNFYKKHNYEKEKQLQCLKKIIEMCPSDQRILDYVSLAKENEMMQCIDILFSYLNYASNKNDVKAWTIFVKLLKDILKRNVPKELERLYDVWHQYDSFWPAYQFSAASLKLSDEQSTKLAMLKATAFYVLENAKADHPFINEVQRSLNVLPYQDLKSKFAKNLFCVKKYKSNIPKKRKWSERDS